MKRFKAFAVLAAAVMMLSTATVLSGCGSNESSGSESSSSAVTTTAPAATKATSYSSAGGNENNAETTAAQSYDQPSTEQDQASTEDGNTDETVESYGEEKHGNITSEEASQIALQNCESGQEVAMVDAAEYNGQDCWHVLVIDTDGKDINCYVSSDMFEAIPQADYIGYYDDADDYYNINGADGAEP